MAEDDESGVDRSWVVEGFVFPDEQLRLCSISSREPSKLFQVGEWHGLLCTLVGSLNVGEYCGLDVASGRELIKCNGGKDAGMETGWGNIYVVIPERK